MIVVSDTSPITNLLRIGRIELLRDLFQKVIIPETVYSEIATIEGQRTALTSRDWINVVSVTNLQLLNRLLVSLDRGEAEAITLAVELSANILLIDEAKGRNEAENLDLEVTGILGILIRAKEKELIPWLNPKSENW